MNHISIIVCSRTQELSNEMQQNIADSIGVDYELIVIDNSRNEYNIFTAYNEGVRRASGEVLCFVHDDVLFRCNNWGGIILEHFCDSTIGIIGVAGSHFLPSTPMYWYDSPFVSEGIINNDDGLIEQFFNTGWFKEEQKIIEVCVVDGLCLFAQRSIFKEISFDEATFNGFHMYDMDICMQALSFGYKVCVQRCAS